MGNFLGETNKLALLHYKKGDRISYPQLEEWNVYEGEKYLIRTFPVGYDGKHGSYLCSNEPSRREVLEWTPHRDVAEEIVARFKKLGWKFKDCTVEVDSLDLREIRRVMQWGISTFAGFHQHIVQRDGEDIVVIPMSDEVKSAIAVGVK